ncbi:tripartite tricarboxylate transporter TctB family protein [Treponema sp. HNW]|uniref:tripartite tricarboxylate transporter TctB family protein n=1 Tax=Treponema sp. HNW TaxID=3116654 RepID=UPI003D126904
MGELFFLGIILIICILFFFMTFNFPVSILDKSGGAGVFPRVVLIFLAVSIVTRIFIILKDKEKKHFILFELFQGTQLKFFLSIAAYILLLNKLGYIIATLLFAYGTVNGFFYYTTGSSGSKKQILIRNICITLFVFFMHYFFSNILNIMLPKPFWR